MISRSYQRFVPPPLIQIIPNPLVTRLSPYKRPPRPAHQLQATASNWSFQPLHLPTDSDIYLFFRCGCVIGPPLSLAQFLAISIVVTHNPNDEVIVFTKSSTTRVSVASRLFQFLCGRCRVGEDAVDRLEHYAQDLRDTEVH